MRKWYQEEDISRMLPTEAVYRGVRLRWWLDDGDPVALYDRKGAVLRQWDYVPSLGEVFEACAEAMSQ